MPKPIRLIRWNDGSGVRLAVSDGNGVLPTDAVLPEISSIPDLVHYCRSQNTTVSSWARKALAAHASRLEVEANRCMTPLDLSELWAAGVTYELSRDAREAETTAAQSFYQKVYDADRPEIFFKAPGYRVAGPGEVVGLREDGRWHVPEPELTVVLDDRGAIFGYTVGNDMTVRDIEAENPLYLPQAKMFYHSAAIGPALVLADTVDAQDLDIELQIRRQGVVLYSAHESTARIRRPLSELIAYLGRAYPISPWTGLMTGTGIVPPDSLALIDGDEIDITISSIGTLSNRAQVIRSREPKD